MSVRISKSRPPWLKDGEPERWVTVKQFAKLMRRKPQTVYDWIYQQDVLAEFGYTAFQDPMGRWRIKIRREDLANLER